MRVLWLCVLLVSCAPSSGEDFRAEGAALAQELAADLGHIQTKGELQAAVPRLRKKFNKLADLALAGREFRAQTGAEAAAPTAASDALFAELARLYELPGGRELIESAQSEAVERLVR